MALGIFTRPPQRTMGPPAPRHPPDLVRCGGRLSILPGSHRPKRARSKGRCGDRPSFSRHGGPLSKVPKKNPVRGEFPGTGRGRANGRRSGRGRVGGCSDAMPSGRLPWLLLRKKRPFPISDWSPGPVRKRSGGRPAGPAGPQRSGESARRRRTGFGRWPPPAPAG